MIDGGTESIAITAGETKDPAKTIPKVVRNVFWRILLFYILSVLILGLNVPYTTEGLDSKETRTSPFTIVFQMAGSAAAGSFINAVIMTSVISAGTMLYLRALDCFTPSPSIIMLQGFSRPLLDIRFHGLQCSPHL